MKSEYDQIKGMLNKIRTFNNISTKNLREQVEKQTNDEYSDINVINGVDIKINSSDSMDIELKDDEKNKISQMIDEFRTNVSPTADFEKLDIYENGAKLNGKIENYNLDFILSTGDDQGVYISNASLLKIDEGSLELINKLKNFEPNFESVLDQILINRKEN